MAVLAFAGFGVVKMVFGRSGFQGDGLWIRSKGAPWRVHHRENIQTREPEKNRFASQKKSPTSID